MKYKEKFQILSFSVPQISAQIFIINTKAASFETNMDLNAFPESVISTAENVDDCYFNFKSIFD